MAFSWTILPRRDTIIGGSIRFHRRSSSMGRNRLAFTSAVLAGALLAVSLPSVGAERAVNDWLRGTGTDLQIRFAGEVCSSQGTPATDITISGEYNAVGGPFPFEAAVEGNRFETWIPVNQMRLSSMW